MERSSFPLRSMIHYFAYGSNLDSHALRHRGVTINSAEIGILRHWKLVFKVIDDEISGAGFATIKPDRESQVEGIIYTIDDASVKVLDCYEDYPRDYTKEILTIQAEDHRSIPCLVYVGQPDRLRTGLKPTTTYLQSLLNGRPFLSEIYYTKLCATETLDA